MAYQSLYRRYRPGKFSEIAGQEHVVAALRNAVCEGRTGHAYLFSGPRGTGKTSTARILAKALNCTDLGDDGEPCDNCDSCEAFNAGTSYDLHELDAASNNGVDAIRDLIGKVALGSPGRTKVYILDEVHMLTAGAENALLKTLEEPPDHVKFVLATTEPHKVVPTIRSRTQHLRFELLPADIMSPHVRWVADDAGLEIDDQIVAHVVRDGGGSVRDTLSALDQVVAAGGVHGDSDAVAGIVDAVAAVDSGAAIASVEAALRSGPDPRVIGESVLGRLRDAFLVSIGADVSHLPETDRERAESVSSTAGTARLTRAMELLGTAMVDMRQAPDPRIDLEVALLRLTRPELDTDVTSLLARIERLESGAPPGAAPPVATSPPEGAAPPVATSPPEGAAAAPAAASHASPPGAVVEQPTGQASDAAAGPGAESSPGTGSPAAAARESLAATRAAGVASDDRPSLGALRGTATATAAEADGDTTSPSRDDQSSPSAEQVGGDPASEPSADAPSLPEEGATSGQATREADIAGIWESVVLPSLSKRARARFQGGHFVSSGPEGATFALPNKIHRDRCHEVRPDVDAALERVYARPVAFELVVADDVARPAAPGGAARGVDPSTDSTVEDETIEITDIGGLADAHVESHSELDRLTQIFPGAEVVDPGAS